MSAREKEISTVNDVLKMPLIESFEADLTKALDDADGSGIVVLVMVDLDNFMRVNDEFGHEVGDQVLIATGEYLRGYCALDDDAGSGAIYRFSGDEFALIYDSGVEKEEIFLHMERMRREYDVKAPDGRQLTLSAGIAASPEDGARYADLVRKADGAMYRAKAQSHNRVCLAREEKMVTKTSHYTAEQLQRLTKLSKREGVGEAVLLREALDAMLRKYDV